MILNFHRSAKVSFNGFNIELLLIYRVDMGRALPFQKSGNLSCFNIFSLECCRNWSCAVPIHQKRIWRDSGRNNTFMVEISQGHGAPVPTAPLQWSTKRKSQRLGSSWRASDRVPWNRPGGCTEVTTKVVNSNSLVNLRWRV